MFLLLKQRSTHTSPTKTWQDIRPHSLTLAQWSPTCWYESTHHYLSNSLCGTSSKQTAVNATRWKRGKLHQMLPPPHLDLHTTRRNNAIPDNHFFWAHFDWWDLVVESDVCESELHHVGCEPAPGTMCRVGIVNLFSQENGNLWK